MSNNLRLQKNGDADDLYSLKSTGADLTDYRDQLARERVARTLTLRRSQRPTLAQFLANAPSNQFRTPLVDINNFPFLDPSYAINQLNTGNATTLPEFLNSITICAQQTPRLAANLVRAPGVSESFINALSEGYSEQLTIAIIKTLIVIFPIAGENQIQYIDDGLTMCLFDFLSSQSVPLLEAAIALTDVIAESSDYARDSILCLGVHQFLIEVAKAEFNEPLTCQACEALNKVFSNRYQIDPNTLLSCVEPLASLLSLHSVNALNSVLMCFLQITNKSAVLVFSLHKLGLFPIIVSMLSNVELVGTALPLIGNLSVGNSDHITALLDCGLFGLLMNLVDQEFTADVFWVLSNLVESAPHFTIMLFDKEFIEKTVDIAMSSSFDVMKESTFFLATLIIFTEHEDLVYFLNENVLDQLIEMLSCGVLLIILRCLDALIRLSRKIENIIGSESILTALQGSDIHQKLTDLTEQKSVMIRERAEFLLSQIDNYSSSILAM